MVVQAPELQQPGGRAGPVKRRKLSDGDQELTICDWQRPRSRVWSPAESEASATTCVASPPSQQPAPNGASREALHDYQAMGRLPSITSLPRNASASWPLEAQASRDFYTPPGQQVTASSQQHAPQLRIDFAQSLPQAGAKRVWLESHSIASQLACGWALPSQSCSWQLKSHNAPQQRLNFPGRVALVGTAEEACSITGPWFRQARFHTHALQPALEASSAGQRDIPLPTLPAYKARCLEQAMRTRGAAVTRYPRTTAGLLEQWASALQLLPDTFRYTLHLHGRVSGRVTIEMQAPAVSQQWHAAVLLLGCLWLAAKHEERRISLPTASKLVALVGGPGMLPLADLNRAELAVLNSLGWQPLKGWDDRLFSKGQPRQQEVAAAAADWSLLQNFGIPLALGW